MLIIAQLKGRRLRFLMQNVRELLGKLGVDENGKADRDVLMEFVDTVTRGLNIAAGVRARIPRKTSFCSFHVKVSRGCGPCLHSYCRTPAGSRGGE